MVLCKEEGLGRTIDAECIFERFGLDRLGGFLSISRPPLSRLSSAIFEPWERIAAELPLLIATRKLRPMIHNLEVINVEPILDDPLECQRAFMLVSFIAHAYVRGRKDDKIANVLPRQLAVPWVKLADTLGLEPISCYAAVVLYNWYIIDSSRSVDLDNIGCMTLSTGCIDEAWFYMVSAAIDATSGPVLRNAIDIQNAVLQDRQEELCKCLRLLHEQIGEITKIIMRMYEECMPFIFYNRVRRFLSGWKNDPAVPSEGILYEGVANESARNDQNAAAPATTNDDNTGKDDGDGGDKPQGKYYSLYGGSAAQNSLVQVLDIILGISSNSGHSTDQGTGASPHRHSSQMSLKIDTNFDKMNLDSNGNSAAIDNTASATTPKINDTNVGSAPGFLLQMRRYMPKNHRELLLWLEQNSTLKSYIMDISAASLALNNRERNAPRADDGAAMLPALSLNVIEAYNLCISALSHFRTKHLEIVAMYIMMEARKGLKEALPAVPIVGASLPASPIIRHEHKTLRGAEQHAGDPRDTFQGASEASSQPSSSKPVLGTGGSNPMVLLRQLCDRTSSNAISLTVPSSARDEKQGKTAANEQHRVKLM